jgi:hypothetical protein
MANWLGGYRVIANHTRTTSSSSAQTSAFDASIEYVRVTTTGPVFIEFGANPTAVAATSIYMAGDESIIFKIDGGMKMATIHPSGTPTVYVQELSE